MRARNWFYLLVCCLLVSCTGLKDRKLALIDALRSYEHAVRWGNANVLKNYHKKPEELAIAQFKQLRVSSYQVQNTKTENNQKTFHQQVEIKYYYLETMSEKIVMDDQIWEFDSKNRTWQRTNKLPLFP